MKKILIAIFLAVMLDGNAHADKDLMADGELTVPTYEECKKALLKGDVLEKGVSDTSGHSFSIHYNDYLYFIIIGYDIFTCHKFDNRNY